MPRWAQDGSPRRQGSFSSLPWWSRLGAVKKRAQHRLVGPQPAAQSRLGCGHSKEAVKVSSCSPCDVWSEPCGPCRWWAQQQPGKLAMRVLATLKGSLLAVAQVLIERAVWLLQSVNFGTTQGTHMIILVYFKNTHSLGTPSGFNLRSYSCSRA